MKKTVQKICAVMLALSMTAASFVSAYADTDTPSVRADAQTDGDLIRGTFTFGPHESKNDLTDTYIYSDSYFKTSSYKENRHLATMSMQMAAASISSEDADYPEKSQNVQALLKALGFNDIQVNEYYTQQMQQNTMGTAAAYKDIGDDTILLAVIPRSAGYEKEWGGNFNVGTGDGDESERYATTDLKGFKGTDGLHAGFQIARNISLEFARSYVEKHKDVFSGKTVKLWTAGYSRGAATANLIGAAVADDAEHALGLQVKPEDVYDYTFGTPATVIAASGGTQPNAEKYNGIHNYYAEYDPVPMVPFSEWGFTRYGQNCVYDTSSANKSRMLKFLKKVNSNVYGIYTDDCGNGDPDNFKAYTLGEGFALVPDDSKSISQSEFLKERIAYLVGAAAKDRKSYVENYQKALSNMISFYLGDSDDKVNAFIKGVSEDKADLVSLIIMAAFYDWADQYEASQTEEKAEKAAEMMKEVLPAPEAQDDYSKDVNNYLNSNEYKAFYSTVTDAEKLEEYLKESGAFKSTYKKQAEESMKAVLTAGAEKVGLDEATKNEMLSDDSVSGLMSFISYFAFGTDTKLSELNDSEAVKDALIEKINTAATLIGNSGTYMRVHNNEVILSWIRTMDTYYDDPAPSHSHSHSSSKPSYTVKTGNTENGSVKLSSSSAKAGTTVDITVTPEKGYETVSVKVTDANGNDIAVTKNENNIYTFVQPSTSVTVNAEFREVSISPAYGDFTDLKADAWYKESVEYALKNKLMNGVSESTFDPSGKAGRTMVTSVLWRMAGSPVVNYAMDLSDVDEGSWYGEAVRWAASEGIVTGYSDGRFGVGDSVTREQFAAMLYRSVQKQGGGFTGAWYFPLNYEDASSISEWADEAMHWCVMNGIMEGTSSTELSPEDQLTRAQMAAMMMRFHNVMNK